MTNNIFKTWLLLALAAVVQCQHGPVAIEVRFERLDNPQAIRDDGRRCDVMSNCDMRVQFHVDTESATFPWPGLKKDISTWYLVDLPANTNMVTLLKTLVARRVSTEYKVDNENKLLVNFRILAEDRDVFTHYDIIERFDCPFSGIPANAERQADWQPPREQPAMSCHGEIHYGRPIADRPTVYFRWRIYKTEIPARYSSRRASPFTSHNSGSAPLPYDVQKLRSYSSKRVDDDRNKASDLEVVSEDSTLEDAVVESNLFNVLDTER